MKNLFLCCVFLFTAIASYGAKTKSVAVYVEGNVSEDYMEIVYSSMADRLSQGKEYNLFERNSQFIKALNREHDFQTGGDVEECEIRKISAKYGVDLILVVKVNFISGDVNLSGRLIDLETGRIYRSSSVTREGISSLILRNASNTLAYKIINKQSK